SGTSETEGPFTGTSTTFIPELSVLIINDFTSDYRTSSDELSFGARRKSKKITCSTTKPDAVAEFDFTNTIVQGIDDAIPLSLYYYADTGDQHFPIHTPLDKNSFAKGDEFNDYVCLEDDPTTPSDLQFLIDSIIGTSPPVDVLLWFSAAPQTDIDICFPISSPNVKNVIAVGLNGTDMSSVYKDSFVNLGIDDDFSHPEYITCMIEQLYR
ncbi:hypothetical protein PMAYCL1PPCAC_04252, partial [Pristionchus mayeri]